MADLLRMASEEALCHITARGNERKQAFLQSLIMKKASISSSPGLDFGEVFADI